MAKQSLDQLIAKFEKLAKEEKKVNFAKEVAKQKKKDAVEEATKKPPTKQEVLAKKVKEMQDQDKYDELTGKGKPEEGAVAVDRLLDAYAQAQKRVYDEDGEVKPEFSAGVTPEKETIKSSWNTSVPGTDRVIRIPFMKREIEVDNPGYDPKGKKGSALRIANQRIDDTRDELDLAQIAKEQGITLQEAKKNKLIQDKYNEYLKKFNVPSVGTFEGKQVVADQAGLGVSSSGIDKIEAKRRYLARHLTQKFFSK